VNYEWDPAKNLSNIRKHKVSFEQAKIALEDPYRLCFYDEAHSELAEERYVVLGNAEGRVLFASIVWVGDDTTRIISTRRASRSETEAYNENRSLFFTSCP